MKLVRSKWPSHSTSMPGDRGDGIDVGGAALGFDQRHDQRPRVRRVDLGDESPPV